jgi:outer membrane protein assembly factor BamB
MISSYFTYLACFLILLSTHAQIIHWGDKTGPNQNQIIDTPSAAPIYWSDQKNILWKLPLNDEGHSTPVVIDQTLWLTSATTDGKQQFVRRINIQTGELIEKKLLFSNESPEILGNPINNYAAPSPVADQTGVYVHFGTYGTAKLNLTNGEVIWQRRDINVNHYRGPGASPILYQNKIIMALDGIDNQFIIALDATTGKTLWKTPRSINYNDLDASGKPKGDGDLRKAFHTPAILNIQGQDQLISIGSRAAYGYDPITGQELWQLPHSDYNAAIRPILEGNILLLNTGSERSHYLALDTQKPMKGLLSPDIILWDRSKRNASESSPVAHQGYLYQITRGGVLICTDIKTGTDQWEERLPGQFLGSLFCLNQNLYLSNNRGQTFVIAAKPQFTKIAENQLSSSISCTPIWVNQKLILRTKEHLIAIIAKQP